MRVIRKQIVDTAYFMDTANRASLDRLPDPQVPVDIEGYGTNARAPGEMPFVLALVNERTGGRASIALDSPDYAQNAYIGPPDQPRTFDPSYRFVLTRMAGIQTDRKVIARHGGIALEERVKPLDVTPVSDLGTPFSRDNPTGTAYIQGALLTVPSGPSGTPKPEPLKFFVTGDSTDRPVYVRIRVTDQVPITVPHQAKVTVSHQVKVTPTFTGGSADVCIGATGTGRVRHAKVSFSFQPQAIPAGNLFRLPGPSEGVELAAMRASYSPCR
jgi:hypothetical protein